MNKIKEYMEKMFEDIKHIDENGSEYWNARELMSVLEYTLWQSFSNVIGKLTCEISKYNIDDYFISIDIMKKLV